MKFFRAFILIILLFNAVFAQEQTASISGKIVDTEEKPLPGISVTLSGQTQGVVSTDSGSFTVSVPANKPIALLFSATGFHTVQRNFYLNSNEAERITVRMERSSRMLEEVVINDERERREVGLVKVNPRHAVILPSPTGGVEGLIKIFVGSNNELTSQYAVRGGNYDENLVYVNDFEIFRPYLIRSGQQEGLSFINPELTGSIRFYNGGFQTKYGDKMSSVLDVQYRKPTGLGGSAYAGLLEQGFHVEGISRNKRFTYLAGVRNRSNRNLLRSQETKGNYVPSSSDIQTLLTYRINDTWQLEMLGNFSTTKFFLIPEEMKLTSSVLSPLFSSNLGLDVYFQGRELDRYTTRMAGLSATQQVNKQLRIKWMLSSFENREQEAYDISGAYLFGERGFDKGTADFGVITNPLGSGIFMQHARNRLLIRNYSAAHKGTYNIASTGHMLQWGLQFDKTVISDRLSEWEAQDSAGYNLPYNSDQLVLNKVLRSAADLDITKASGYLQDNIVLNEQVTVQGGVRFNYNTLNREFIVSPRVNLSWQPQKNEDWVLKLAAGAYDQPAFYREMRRYDGTLNADLKAQKSWQFVAGAEYNFNMWNKRPSRLTIEAYHKAMRDVSVYDIDNVRIRYTGNNNARAYATGLEIRLFSEIVKDAESWVSLGFMRSREKIADFHYYRYKNAAGEFITAQTEDQVVADSVRFDQGWMRRPTDRLVTFGMFFQDYLTTNKNFKVHLHTIFGSNMPYNIPGSVRYRNALVIEPYMRVDIGFSALLLSSETINRRRHHPFRGVKNIWASLEVFNLLDRGNTISYMLIKDFSNTVYTMPNRLTPRLLNAKIMVRF